MKYQIVIPSLGRAHLINKLTLGTLKRYGVDNSIIHVFVSNKEDAVEYAKVLEKGIKLINVNTKGITPTREAISNYFKEDDLIVSLDDDIEKLEFAKDSKTLIELESFDDLVTRGFKFCEKSGATLWGIYPVRNAFFMKQTVTANLTFICGFLFGYKNIKDPSIKINAVVKDDYERSILLYMRDGAVIRFNYVCAKQKFYRPDGGASTYRTQEVSKKDADYLVAKYPMFVRHNTARNSGFAEVIFINNKGI